MYIRIPHRNIAKLKGLLDARLDRKKVNFFSLDSLLEKKMGKLNNQ
jgi:hypothetical protein